MPTLTLMVCLLAAQAAPALAAGAGGLPGAFLRQEADARSAALAGAVGASVDEVSALTRNPAVLARLSKPQLHATHVTLFEDTAFDQVAAAAGSRWGGFGAAYLRQASGGFERRATPFDSPTSFSITQSALFAGWGLSLPLPFRLPGSRDPKPLEAGVAFKSVRETIDTVSAAGTGADMGLALRAGPLALGLALQNALPPNLTFVSRPVRYPRRLEFTPAFRWDLPGKAGALASLRFSRIEDGGLSFSAGMELDYGRRAFARAAVAQKGISTGAGVRLGNMSLDYAVLLHELGLSHIVSFTQRFGQTPEELQETIRRGIRRLSRGEARRLSKAYLLSAEMKLKEERLQEALSDLEAAALLDPEDEQLPRRIERLSARIQESLKKRVLEGTAALARQEFSRGNLLASRQYWRSVIEMQADHAEASDQLSRIDGRLSEMERKSLEALREQQQAMELSRAVFAAEESLAAAKPRAALEQAQKAARLSSEDVRVRPLLARAREALESWRRSAIDGAKRHLAGSRPQEALLALEPLLSQEPGNAQALQLAQDCRKALRRELSQEERKRIEQLYYRAVEFYLKGGFRESKALADEITAADPASEHVKKLKEKIAAAMEIGGGP